MTQLHTIIKLGPDEVGIIQACIELCRDTIPDDKDMERLERRFTNRQYTLE